MTGIHKIFNYDKGPSQKSPFFKHRTHVFYIIFWKRHLFPFHLPMKHIIEATFLVNYTSSTYEESGFWNFEIKLLKFENFLGAQKWVGAQMSRGPNGSGTKWVGAQMCWGPNESGAQMRIGPKCVPAILFGWGTKVYVQNRLEPSSGILHCYHLTTLTSQDYNPCSVVYVPEPIRAI